MKTIFIGLVILMSSYSFANNDITQPRVSKQVLNCDQWFWIGGNSTAWGCFSRPWPSYVAAGETTDQVIASLQDQINKLKTRLEELEKRP